MTEQSEILKEERQRQRQENLTKRITKVVVSGNPPSSEKSPAIQEAEKRNTRITTDKNIPSGYKYPDRAIPLPSNIKRGKDIR